MSTKYKLRITGECKQNMKLCKRRGLPMDELWTVVGKLLNGEELEEKYQAHVLTGDRKGQWECHIQQGRCMAMSSNPFSTKMATYPALSL